MFSYDIHMVSRGTIYTYRISHRDTRRGDGREVWSFPRRGPGKRVDQRRPAAPAPESAWEMPRARRQGRRGKQKPIDGGAPSIATARRRAKGGETCPLSDKGRVYRGTPWCPPDFKAFRNKKKTTKKAPGVPGRDTVASRGLDILLTNGEIPPPKLRCDFYSRGTR